MSAVRSILSACLICAAAACEQGASAPASGRGGLAREQLVRRGTLEDRMLLTGELEAKNSESLYVPRTPTWMISLRWLAEDGAAVKKGDKVVEFDSSSFASSIEDKRLAVSRAESELATESAKAASTLAEKSMEVERQRAELEKALVEASVPSDLYPRRVYQDKQLAFAQRRDALAKAEEELAAQKRAAGLDLNMKELARVRAARELTELTQRLDDLTLRAPRDGMVQISVSRREGRKHLVGDQVYPGTVVVSLPDLTAMQVHARLSDVDDGTVREGMAAECVLDAYPRKLWKGTVRQVSPVARAEGRDASRRFFDVVVSLDEVAADIMRPGMSVRVEVIRHRAESALLVPRAALRGWPAPNRAQVRLPGGAVQTIEVDFCAELDCVVRSGLLEGGAVMLPAASEKGAS